MSGRYLRMQNILIKLIKKIDNSLMVSRCILANAIPLALILNCTWIKSKACSNVIVSRFWIMRETKNAVSVKKKSYSLTWHKSVEQQIVHLSGCSHCFVRAISCAPNTTSRKFTGSSSRVMYWTINATCTGNAELYWILVPIKCP